VRKPKSQSVKKLGGRETADRALHKNKMRRRKRKGTILDVHNGGMIIWGKAGEIGGRDAGSPGEEARQTT